MNDEQFEQWLAEYMELYDEYHATSDRSECAYIERKMNEKIKEYTQ